MLVCDCMSPHPLVVQCQEPVDRIAVTMQRMRIHQVPVVDESNRLVGILTDRDIRSALGYGNNRMGLVAEDIMTTDVETVTPDADLIHACNLICRRRIGALPVVEGDRIVGILTRHDLVRVFQQFLRKERDSESVGGGAKKATAAP